MNTTERKPVNVLDVMDQDANEAGFSRRRASSPYADELKRDSEEARAAVAELIEEVEATLDLLETQGYAPMHAKLLRAALARCGGA